MSITDLAIVTLITLGMLIVLALPAWVSWFVAQRSRLPARRMFVLICTLFAYGCLAISCVALLPLDVAETYIAPDLHASGHPMLANAIFVASERVMPGICFFIGLFGSFFIPFKLRRFWPRIAAAVGANNSFNPTAEVGPIQ